MSKQTKTLSEILEEKFIEYDYDIVVNKVMDDKNMQRMFIMEDMLVYINEDENSISVSFEASLIPSVVARHMVVFSEIECKLFYIMEEFVFENGVLVTGDDAVKIAHKRIATEGKRSMAKDEIYNSILRDCKGFEC